MNIKSVLEQMVRARASDLHVKVGSPPTIRVDGSLYPIDGEPAASQKDIETVVDQILTPKQKKIFEETKEVDFAFSVPGLSRFRSNFYQQRGTVALAFRQIPFGVPNIRELNLPVIMEDLALKPRGMVLVTGTVGMGKSTTLAAMIHSVNTKIAKNVITIEDPVEFLHRDEKALISQREVGLDTDSFHEGLKHILRQDPDVILLGEIRDPETMSIAIMAADTGHLVLSTLHTVDAAQTLNRVMSFYPPHQHEEIRFLLSANLIAVVSLRLIPRKGGVGRVPAVEVMVNTATIKEYIIDPRKTSMIHKAIQEGVNQYGMQTFDQSLMRLYKDDLISLEDALNYSTNPTEFDLRARGIHSASDKTWEHFEKGEKVR